MTMIGIMRVDSGAAPYFEIGTPAPLPFTTVELGRWLKFPAPTISADTDTLQLVIEAVVRAAELYTKRTFIYRQFETFRDGFTDYDTGNTTGLNVFTSRNTSALVIRRTRLRTIDKIEYLKDGDTLIVPAQDYYFTQSDSYSKLLPVPDQSWPEPDRDRLQTVKIEFTAGYSETPEIFKAQHSGLREAMLQHAAYVYWNRGDFFEVDASKAPRNIKTVYDQYRIVDFRM